jgi:sugar phosphate isomerase/epimerase
MLTRREWVGAAAGTALYAAGGKFPMPPGLQMYSLRREAARDLPGTLALVRRMGFREVETGDFHGRTVQEYAQLLAAHGLRATCYGADWQALLRSASAVGETARTLGAGYVMCGSIPVKPLTVEAASRAADNFNRWGEELAKAGVRFCYHPHGPEFAPSGEGTLFELLARRMDPKYANFEMDVFWFLLGGVDPARAFERWPGRFPIMHLKDPRKGEPKTFDPGPVEEEASVPLGQGQIDWPPLLRAALRHKVARYYLEEEHPAAVRQIPQSLAYLEKVAL